MSDELVIVLPECSDDQISTDLRYLTETLRLNRLGDTDYLGGLLGVENGYGVPFENDVFQMHPFCWCDREDCDWCLGCMCPDSAYTHYLADGTECDAETFYAHGGYSTGRCEHRPECDYCTGKRKRAANFLHKPSGSRVEWYKYIGRGMEIELHADWRSVFADCVASLAARSEAGPQ